MNNRFNELDILQQNQINQLVNALAANQHVSLITRDLIIYDAINKINDAGRAAMTLEDVR